MFWTTVPSEHPTAPTSKSSGLWLKVFLKNLQIILLHHYSTDLHCRVRKCTLHHKNPENRWKESGFWWRTLQKKWHSRLHCTAYVRFFSLTGLIGVGAGTSVNTKNGFSFLDLLMANCRWRNEALACLRQSPAYGWLYEWDEMNAVLWFWPVVNGLAFIQRFSSLTTTQSTLQYLPHSPIHTHINTLMNFTF